MSKYVVSKRIMPLVLLAILLVSFCGCNNSAKKHDYRSSATNSFTSTPDENSIQATDSNINDDVQNDDIPNNDTTNNDGVWEDDDWTDDDNDSSGSVSDEVIVGTVTESGFEEAVKYSNSIANKIQAKYVDGDRNSYEISNTESILTENLYSADRLGTTLKNKSGKSYFEDTLDVYAIDSNGDEYGVIPSLTSGMINTTKLGYYYYDVNVRNLYMGYTDGVSYIENSDVDMTPSLWRVNDMESPYTDSAGHFSAKVTDTHDPYFYIKGLDTDGKKTNAVEITLKTDSDSSNCALYFYTSDKSGFNSEQMSFFNLKTDGDFHTYLVPIENFEKNIAGVRFDLGTEVGQTVTVKSVRFAYVKQTDTPIAVEKTFHSYPDKIHFEASVLSTSEALPVKNIKEYGYKVTINKTDFLSAVIGINGKTATPELFKLYKNPEYIGIDIKNTGIVGFVIPNDGSTYGLKISETDGIYTLYIFNRPLKTIQFGKPVSLSSRIYCDSTHSFDGLAKIARQERNPFTHITVRSSQNGRFVGYDYAAGAYIFSINGTDFNSAYKKSGKNKYFSADISVTASDDRVIYVSMRTDAGSLEGAAVTTADGISLPIPIEVCKNFYGEIEEPIYDPNDVPYGYSILPIKVAKNTKYDFTLYHLYQNWGKFPIKQISSISFHVSYYHLSTGVTESNCIAPYYVYGKDGWTLPDFRGCSGKMWDSQPQFNSVGRVYFTKHKDSAGNVVMSEYTNSEIRSSGNTYADMDYAYIADDGAYKYNLRHFELPQTDENRTMYELSLEFLTNMTFNDVKNDLSLFSFDGRSVTFSKASYLAEDNTSKIIQNSNTDKTSDIYILGKSNPYFSYYDFALREGDPSSGMNFGVVVRDYEVNVAGKKWNGNIVFKNEFDGTLNVGTLSLNMGNVTFKKGDKITLTLVLIPYGLPNAENSENVDYVIDDFVKHPFSLSAEKGNVITDGLLPVVKCVDNEAVLTASGGRNNQTIKVIGYSKLSTPKIYEKINGKWVIYDYHVKGNFDGYTVQYEDGKYSYSFVCDMGKNPETAKRTFRVVVD